MSKGGKRANSGRYRKIIRLDDETVRSLRTINAYNPMPKSAEQIIADLVQAEWGRIELARHMAEAEMAEEPYIL